ncbi:MAG: fibronectin type III domain-containing protein, partial [Planctomycetes bacterium]|nr:fibronectin type III domain-containing protein [Planctomycetota bacterium]
DNEAVTQYRIYQDDSLLTTTGVDPLEYEITGLSAATEYTFKVEAGDAADNWSDDGPTVTITTADSAPTWPGEATLIAEDITETTLTLRWPVAAEDDQGVTGYKIYIRLYPSPEEELVEVGGDVQSYAVTGLSPSVEYMFHVEAGDASGNWTTNGPDLTVNTVDLSPPYWPEPKSLSASNRQSTSIELTFSSAEDNVGIYAYNLYIYRGGEWVLAMQADDTSITIECLTPNTSFFIKVEAQDYSGNISDDGPTATVSTTSDPADCSGVMERASVNSAGEETIGVHAPPTEWDPLGWDPHESENPSISSNGRYVAFESIGINLVPDDNNTLHITYYGQGWSASWHSDIFVRDRLNGITQRASVSSNEVEGEVEGSSRSPSISANGRYVAFSSSCSNLVSGDTNGKSDIFLRNLYAGTTHLISRSYLGAPADNFSNTPSISADGRLVAFVSYASNLVPGDTNNRQDVFVYDRHTGKNELISVATDGAQADRDSWGVDISADGRWVVFVSEARNLSEQDTNYYADVYVHDRIGDETTVVSVSSDGIIGNGRCCMESASKRWAAAISDDGRYVAFDSIASNLVQGDSNNKSDVFVHDLMSGITRRASISSDAIQGNDYSYKADISGNGRFVVFESQATNLDGDEAYIWARDVFVHDMILETTRKISKCPCGADGDDGSFLPAVNEDGSCIAFESYAANLLVNLGDTNRDGDIFVMEQEILPFVDLSVDITTVPSPGRVGSNLNYSVTVTNHGPDDATNIVLVDTLADEVVFVSANVGQGDWSIENNTVTWNLEELQRGESMTLVVRVICDVEAVITNSANVSCTEADIAHENDIALIETQVVISSSPDFNGDDDVDLQDVSLMAAEWRLAGSPYSDIAPDGGDGVVDVKDLLLLIDLWLSHQ